MPYMSRGRLRAAPRDGAFEILLLEPEIPPNTGNVARLCAATGCPLHLVGKLGFKIDDHAVRRAGLDYWPLVRVSQHETLPEAEAAIEAARPLTGRRFWLFSGKATQSYFDAPIREGDVLVFGRESVGLPESLLESRANDVVGLPTLGDVRSLNLANSAAIALYEGLRRIGALEIAADRR